MPQLPRQAQGPADHLARGKILLMRRASTEYGEGQLAFPAGHADLGETPTASIIRETAEELGIAITPASLTPAGVMFRRSLEPRVDFFFTASAGEGTPQIRGPCSPLTEFPRARSARRA